MLVPVRREILAGAGAAAVWTVAEPLIARVIRVGSYSDRRLLGRAVTRSRLWPVVGIAAHLGNGAVFGFLFARAGAHGVVRGVLAAQAENALLWPGMAVVDRFHPDRKSGEWSPLLANGRVFAYEAACHAVFGVALGLLYPGPTSD
jgi:hypothetical protein